MSNGAFLASYQPSVDVSGFSWLVTSGTYCHGIISRSAGGNGLRGESAHSDRLIGLPSSTSVNFECFDSRGTWSSSGTATRVATSISRR